MLKFLLFGESIDVFINKSYEFFHKAIKTAILTSQKSSNAKDKNCIFGKFLKLYLQNSFEGNLKIVL